MSNKQTADYINRFFTSLTEEFSKIKNEWLLFGNQDHLPPITRESVTRKLSNIASNKAAGASDPNVKIIKMFAQYFAVPLTDIYNRSFKGNIFSGSMEGLRCV